MEYHNPVLLNECIEGLNIKPTGIYVDVTFGGGGHSKLILKNLKGGKLFAFDQDESANKNVLDGDGFRLINANFRYLKNFLRMEGVRKIDGLLADLGVSSHQFDVPERGFSIRFDGELDMRMNTNSPLSAKEVVNEYAQQDLANLLYKYGELRNSRSIAKEIVKARETKTIVTTNQFIDVVNHMVPAQKEKSIFSSYFPSYPY
jgi:16S rRNA (cytosine1402-N4)-methyltransferase